MNTDAGSEKSRREFLKILAGCTASVGLSGLSFASKAGGQMTPDKPNILLMVVDDLNDWVGCLNGHPQVQTPNIDRLAQRGMLFANAHVAAPFCNPSRVAFMTGIRPSTSGIYRNDQRLRNYLPNVVTLPQYFKANGYRTMGGGKVFHHPDPVSWDEYFPALDCQVTDEPYPAHHPASGIEQIKKQIDWYPLDVEDQEMKDGKTARWAADVLSRSHDRPFFLAAGMRRPHVPFYFPTKYNDPYPAETVVLPDINSNDLEDLPATGINYAKTKSYDLIAESGQLPQAVAAYLACISFCDAQLGVILDALDRSRYAGNTIVLLWSDNGFHLGEKLHWGKNTLWARSTHTPLIIAAPGLTAPGSRCDRPVSMIDVFPTLTEISGLPPENGIEGASLKSLLQDPNSSWDRPAITTAQPDDHSVRSERYRYIHYADGGEELYDDQSDPLEQNNLAENPEYASVKANLVSWLPVINTP